MVTGILGEGMEGEEEVGVEHFYIREGGFSENQCRKRVAG